MAAPKTTTWEAAPHTLAKHAILRRYLQAWFPILAKHHGRLVYLDGFAGPGRYSRGEEGSPIIALDTALKHFAPLQSSRLVFVFVERKGDRLRWLRDVEIPRLQLAPHFEIHTFEGEFEQVLGGLLDGLDAKGLQIAPTFAFIDPFGITGLPFTLVERLLQRRHCEALVTFMGSSIHRFVTQLPDQVNTLIGTPDAAARISAAEDPGLEARRLYAESLRRVAQFVRFFEMRGADGVPIYDLFFATKHPLGHQKMKEAMWSVDAMGTYTFCDGIDPNQLAMFGANAAEGLAPLLCAHFRGRGDVAWEEIRQYVLDETAYVETHAKKALVLLERAPDGGMRRVVVQERKPDGTRRKKGTFPAGTIVRFLG